MSGLPHLTHGLAIRLPKLSEGSVFEIHSAIYRTQHETVQLSHPSNAVGTSAGSASYSICNHVSALPFKLSITK